MQKQLIPNTISRFEEDLSSQSSISTTRWWERLLQKIKSKWNLWTTKKTFHLHKEKKESRIIPFSQPQYIVELKGISVNHLLEPSIDVFLFAKETATIYIYLRDESKKILHQTSQLVFKGEQDFSIILNNNALSHDTLFIQIRERSGKSQSLKLSLRNTSPAFEA